MRSVKAVWRLCNQVPGGIPDLGDTSLRGTVRRVVITLTTELQLPGNDSRPYTLTSDVWLRNG